MFCLEGCNQCSDRRVQSVHVGFLRVALSSTPKTLEFKKPKTPLFRTENPSVGSVELRSFWCGTERFWGLKRGSPFVLN